MGIMVNNNCCHVFSIVTTSIELFPEGFFDCFGLYGRAVAVVSPAGITCDCNTKFNKTGYYKIMSFQTKRKNKTGELKKNPRKESPTVSNLWLKHSAKNIIIIYPTSFKIFLLI